MSRMLAFVLSMLAVSAAFPCAAGEMVLRYALTGRAEEVLASLTQRFNEEQLESAGADRERAARVVLQNLRTLDDAARRRLPQLALLDTDDSVEFFSFRPEFTPLYKVMAESGSPVDARQFFPLVSADVEDERHRMQALPLGLSLPVLMWNRAVFRKAGLDPDRPPRSWQDVQDRAGRLRDAGVACPVTSSRFAWVHLENLSAQHGTPILVHEKSGAVRINLNRLVDIKHLALLASWQKSLYFRYFGPGAEADRRFLSGECAMITGEASLVADARRAGLDVAVADLPYYDDMRDATPGRLLPGGASLWIIDVTRDAADDRAIARFVAFLLRPEVQAEWLRGTTFLPMTAAALDGMKAVGADPAMTDALRLRLSRRGPARQTHGGGLDRLHNILGEEIAFVWANAKSVKEALDTAMRRVNSADIQAETHARWSDPFPAAVGVH